MPTVSIILPNFNHAAFLEQRLNSIINQTFQAYELIVLDDCSTDKSMAIFEKYSAHIDHLIVNDKNSGSPFNQWKKGMEKACGKWIWIAESDDYCTPVFLERLLNINTAAKIRYCQTYDVDTKGEVLVDRLRTTDIFKYNIWESNFEMDGKTFCRNYLKVKNVIPNASAVIFRKDLITPDIFSTEMLRMRMCGDWLFWVRLLRKTSIAFCAEYLNYFRSHPASSRTHQDFEKIAGRLREETAVRRELHEIGDLNQEEELKVLREKWYAIHRIEEIFSRTFNRFNSKRLFPFFQFRFLLWKVFKRKSQSN